MIDAEASIDADYEKLIVGGYQSDVKGFVSHIHRVVHDPTTF